MIDPNIIYNPPEPKPSQVAEAPLWQIVLAVVLFVGMVALLGWLDLGGRP